MSFKFYFIGIITLFCVGFLFSCADNNIHSNKIVALPNFSFEDILGRKLSVDITQNHYLYIQFINLMTYEIEDEIRKLYEGFKNSDKFYMIFFINENIVPHFYSKKDSQLFFVYEKDKSIRLKFGAPICCNNYYIYNQQHKLVIKGMLNASLENDVRPLLREILEEELFEFFNAKYRYNKIGKSGLPVALVNDQSIFNQNVSYHFVALLNKICSECPIERVITHINRLYNIAPSSISFIILMSEDYNDVDINNLKKSLNINMPIQNAPSPINDLWFQLRTKVPTFFDNILLILDRYGTVQDIFDQENPDGFFSRLENICKK